MTQNRFISDPAIPWVEVRLTDESSASYKDHSHPELSIGAVTYGTIIMNVQGQKHLVPAESMVVIGPECVHSCNPQDGPRSYLMAYFDVSWCLSIQHGLLGPCDALQLPENPLVYDPELFSRLIGLVHSLAEFGFALKKSEQLTQFVGDLLISNSRLVQQEAPAPPRALAEIKEHLRRSLDKNHTLQQLADEVGYNPYYLLRCFKKNFGLTPHEYRLNIRIDRAKELLRSGLSPALVAAETGFVDQSHFHRTFRQFVAATPRQYQLRS